MILGLTNFKHFLFFRLGIISLLIVFVLTSSGITDVAQAQAVIDLPAPGTMVSTSIPFKPLEIKGILVNIKNPLRFEFLIDKGDSSLSGQPLKDEIIRLSKYFLTSLAVPEEDLWVNLSPYEKDRIVPGNFGFSLMGRDLLEQDYLLKQIMASLSYPENDLGKRFWQRVYKKSYELYGTTDIPINTFNKVWILPKSAEVYAQGNSAFVVNSKLDVMLEADFKAFIHHQGVPKRTGDYSQVFRDVILPLLRQEVNTGKNFAVVRQVFNGMILATWYKRHLKDSLLGRMYVGRNVVMGVDIADRDAKVKIFNQYLKAYKKCVYNYIKEDYDPLTQQIVPHKYASGGVDFVKFGVANSAMYSEVSSPRGMIVGNDLAMATVDLAAIARDRNGDVVRFPFMGAEAIGEHPFRQISSEVQPVSSNQAMLSGLDKFVKNWKSVLMIAVAAGVIFPSVAEGRRFQSVADKNGNKTQVEIRNKGGQPPKLLEEDPDKIKREIEESQVKPQAERSLSEIPTQDDERIPPRWKFILEISGAVAAGLIFKLRGNSFRGLFYKKPKPVTLPGPTPLPFVNLLNTSDHKNLLNQDFFTNTTLSPPGADEREQKFLRQDLENLRKVDRGETPPPPSILPKEDLIPGSGGGKSLKWMDVGAFFGTLGLSLYLDGGITWAILLTSVLITRPFYGLQEKLHEILFHMVPATPLYPRNIKDIWSARNIKGQKSLSLWIKQSLPLTNVHHSSVDLRPFASKDSSPKRNRIVGASGFVGSLLLAGSALMLLWLNPLVAMFPSLSPVTSSLPWMSSLLASAPWLAPTLSAPLVFSAAGVLKRSYESGDLTGSADSRLGIFGCGIAGAATIIRSFQRLTKKEMDSFFNWIFDIFRNVMKRGNQEFGGGIYLMDAIGKPFLMVIKKMSEKRDWKFWQNWAFYSNTFREFKESYLKAFPAEFLPLYNYTSFTLLVAFFHSRLATIGDLVLEAAHPQSSPMKKRVGWVFDANRGLDQSKIREVGPHGTAILAMLINNEMLTKVYDDEVYVDPFISEKEDIVKTMVREAGGNAVEQENTWSLLRDSQGRNRKVFQYFQTTISFNGDLFKNIMKYLRKGFKDLVLGFAEIRRFYAASVHQRYQGRVDIDYLKRTVSNGDEEEQEVRTSYMALLEDCHDLGYVNAFGYVKGDFTGIDREKFRKDFPKYKSKIFDQLEYALFGLPPGDAINIALEVSKYETSGSGQASMSFANLVFNRTILSEEEEESAGRFFDGVYDQVEPFLSRRGYIEQDPERVRSFGDQYVRKEEAEELGLMDQFKMLEIFRGMLNTKMQALVKDARKDIEEGKKPKGAAKLFLQWEEQWEQEWNKSQGLPVDDVRREFIEFAVEKFFTGDNISAVKEFADRNDGKFGLYVRSSLANGVTIYKNRQGVFVGVNQHKNHVVWASTRDSILQLGKNGEDIEEVLKLEDGEIVNISSSALGKMLIRSWKKKDGKWVETKRGELAKRLKPTAEFVLPEQLLDADAAMDAGQERKVPNPYFAIQPHVYKDDTPMGRITEEYSKIPGQLSKALEVFRNKNSINAKFAKNLSHKISTAIKMDGKARVVIIAYGNNNKLAHELVGLMSEFTQRLKIEVLDPNLEFNESPRKYVNPNDGDRHQNDIFWLIDESGSTASTLESLDLLQRMLPNEKNIMASSARSDSELISNLSHDNMPEAEGRYSSFGQFFTVEQRILSEPLMAHHLIQMALNVGIGLEEANDSRNSLHLRMPAGTIKPLADEIMDAIIQEAQEIIGHYNENGRMLKPGDKKINKVAERLSNATLETWKKARWMDALVFLIQFQPVASLLLGSYIHSWIGGSVGGLLGAVLNWYLIMYKFPSWRIDAERKKNRRPANGRTSAFQLWIAGRQSVASTLDVSLSRGLVNRIPSVGPGSIRGVESYQDYMETVSHKGLNGDVTLLIVNSYDNDRGLWAVEQVKFNKTAKVANIQKGQMQLMRIVVNIPIPKMVPPEYASLEEREAVRTRNNIVNSTAGFMGEILAGKVIQYEMAKKASMNGRISNPEESFANALVISTQIRTESEEAIEITSTTPEDKELELKMVKEKKEHFRDQSPYSDEIGVNWAMLSKVNDHHKGSNPGGVTMNSRLMDLKINENPSDRYKMDGLEVMTARFERVTPKVVDIVPVTPGMLRAMLGEFNLN